jgi:AcrR family transcriptional regulator
MKIPKSTDRRVKRTRRLLRDALLALVLERGWDQVSVMDVCERADVGRSTFYTHFADREALLLSGYEDLREHLRAETQRVGDGSRLLSFLPGLLAHVEENRRLFRALVGKRAGQLAVANFRRFVFEMVGDELSAEFREGAKLEHAARYVGGGISELLIWFVDARPAPPATDVQAACVDLTKPLIAKLRGKSEVRE